MSASGAERHPFFQFIDIRCGFTPNYNPAIRQIHFGSIINTKIISKNIKYVLVVLLVLIVVDCPY